MNETKILGKKIVNVRQMTEKEVNAEYWDRGTTLIELEDGTLIYPSQDDEGNGCGALFGKSKSGELIRLGYQE